MPHVDFDRFMAEITGAKHCRIFGELYTSLQEIPLLPLGFRLLNMDAGEDFEQVNQDIIDHVFGAGTWAKWLAKGLSYGQLGRVLGWLQVPESSEMDFDAANATATKDRSAVLYGKKFTTWRDLPIEIAHRLDMRKIGDDLIVLYREAIDYATDTPGTFDALAAKGMSVTAAAVLVDWILRNYPEKLPGEDDDSGNAPAGATDPTPAITGTSSSPTSPESTESISNDPAA